MYVVLTDVLFACFAKAGVEVSTLAGLYALTFPYLLKPLYAWQFDRARCHGHLSYWQLTFACMLALLLVFLSLSVSVLNFTPLMCVCLCLGYALASCLDVAIDALKQHTVAQASMSYIATLVNAGYATAWMLVGGAMLLGAEFYAWRSVFLAFTLCYCLMMLGVLGLGRLCCTLTEGSNASDDSEHANSAVLWRDHVKSWFSEPKRLQLILLITSLRFQEAAFKPFLISYLIQGMALRLTEVCLYVKCLGCLASLLGVWGVRRVFGSNVFSYWQEVFVLLCLQALCGVLFCISYTLQEYRAVMLIVLLLQCFSTGAVGTTVMVWVAGLCKGPMAGFQVSCFSSMFLLQKLLLAGLCAWVIDYYGWGYFGVIGVACSVLASGAAMMLKKSTYAVERERQALFAQSA